MVKRLDTLEVAGSDPGGVASIYQRNFAFKIVRRTPGVAVLAIGDAQIRIASSGPSVEALLASSGEGMAALWLEADDVDAVASALTAAGFKFEPVRVEQGRRVLAVDPASANHVPVFIFDRKA